MLKTMLILASAALVSCSALKKDNEPKHSGEASPEVRAQLDVYRPLLKAEADSYGLVRMGGSVGDSALFSCLALAAGAAEFDPSILFVNGKPIRHPEIAPGISKTPVSRDMVSGILWCMLDLHRRGDTDKAKKLLADMISYGRSRQLKVGSELGWQFCSEDDRDAYAISDKNWFGRCFMPPATIKDIYRVAKLLGLSCDANCQSYMITGPNIPANGSGFVRHLAVLATVRNGLVDGAINDNSLKNVLQNAAESQPRNALYQAAYHLFGDGEQDVAYAALLDRTLFPAEGLPTSANFCTDYLFQRDEDEKDWAPCEGDGGSHGRGVEWVFAAALALGEIR